MAMRTRLCMLCLFAAGAAVCAAQEDRRTIAMHWADHYAVVYQVPRELVHAIIDVELAGIQVRFRTRERWV
jgi:hypothetical protein